MTGRIAAVLSRTSVDGAIALSPAVLAAFGLGTPWPDLWQGAALAVFVNLCVLTALRSKGKPRVTPRPTLIILALSSILSIVVFFVISNQMIEYYTTPGVSRPEPIVVGYDVREDWQVKMHEREEKWLKGAMSEIEGVLLPRNPSRLEQLRANEYNPDRIWTSWSLCSVRLGLLGSWVLFIGSVTAFYGLQRYSVTLAVSPERLTESDLLSNDEVIELVQFSVNHGLPAKRGLLLRKYAQVLPECDTPTDQVYSDIINLASRTYVLHGSEHPFVSWIKTAIGLLSSQPRAVEYLQRYQALVSTRLSDTEPNDALNPSSERPTREPS